MSNTIGHVKNLDASRTEALQGLLRSLSHTNDDLSSDATSSAEQLRRFSEKIKEILGDGDGEDLGLISGNPPRQFSSEDGLPIDISESVNEDFQTNTSSSLIPEQDLISPSLLPPHVREQRRRERERILDLLEEEERLQQLQEERHAEEERREVIRKRKESAKTELEQLKTARDLQRRMGQALVQHAKEVEENGQKDDAHSKLQTPPSAAKKRVSFADVPVVEADERDRQTSIDESDWGDVTPARLRAQTRVALVSATEAQKYPMKMRVVERRPAASPTSSLHNDADSDDESTSAGNLSSRYKSDSSDEENRPSSSNNDLSDDEPLEERFDYGIAQHHHEIVLEYHKKRHAIGAETTKVMGAYILDDHDQRESSNIELPLSRFRADHMVTAYDNAYGPDSTSIGQSVIPASRQKYLRNSVRLGKLESDRLTGGESGESESEDETVREVIQMLRTGKFQNVGPDSKTSSTSVTTPPRHSDTTESSSTPAHGAKPSRFKVARRGGITETATFQGNGSNGQPQPTISNVVERKAQKPFSSQRSFINDPPPRSPVESLFPESVPPMIIDSPSFPVTSTPSSSLVHRSASPHQTRLECPPLGISDTSAAAAQGLMVLSRDETPISKFMTERKTRTNY